MMLAARSRQDLYSHHDVILREGTITDPARQAKTRQNEANDDAVRELPQVMWKEEYHTTRTGMA
jgi:hypothetical protein